MFNDYRERQNYEARQSYEAELLVACIDPHLDKRGCPTWYEYARVFRIIAVTTRHTAIGAIYTAYLPTGRDFETTNLRDIEREAYLHECRAFRMVATA
jgi:hypothetical protein